MADINHIITLGIGTPGTIRHFVLMGLNPNEVALAELPDVTVTSLDSSFPERTIEDRFLIRTVERRPRTD